jgi:hypothetical protein
MTRADHKSVWLFSVFIVIVFLFIIFQELKPIMCNFSAVNGNKIANDYFNCFEFWFNRYQTFLSGMIALGAALLGSVFLHRQTLQIRQSEAERYARKHIAARSIMPLALADICDLAERNTSILAVFLENFDENDTVGRIEFGSLSQDSIRALAEIIESYPSLRSPIFSELIRLIQVHQARIRSLNADIIGLRRQHRNISGIREYICDAVEIYALAGSLFGYARQESGDVENITLSFENLYSSLNINASYLTSDDRILEILRRKAKTWQNRST